MPSDDFINLLTSLSPTFVWFIVLKPVRMNAEVTSCGAVTEVNDNDVINLGFDKRSYQTGPFRSFNLASERSIRISAINRLLINTTNSIRPISCLLYEDPKIVKNIYLRFLKLRLCFFLFISQKHALFLNFSVTTKHFWIPDVIKTIDLIHFQQ